MKKIILGISLLIPVASAHSQDEIQLIETCESYSLILEQSLGICLTDLGKTTSIINRDINGSVCDDTNLALWKILRKQQAEIRKLKRQIKNKKK